MYILNHWSIKDRASRQGGLRLHLCGKVFGHTRFAAGEFISTSALRRYRFETDSVVTCNGSEYRLGTPDGADPAAKQRLIRLLADISLDGRRPLPSHLQPESPSHFEHTTEAR